MSRRSKEQTAPQLELAALNEAHSEEGSDTQFENSLAQSLSGRDFDSNGAVEKMLLEIQRRKALALLDEADGVDDSEDEEERGNPEEDDQVGMYLREIAGIPLLTAEDEQMLAKLILAGHDAYQRLESVQGTGELSLDEEQSLVAIIDEAQQAFEYFVKANTRLVISVAKRYKNQGLPFLDLIQEGNVGLMRAVTKFDHTRGLKFSTYGVHWIRQAITRALSQKTRTVRIPTDWVDRIRKMYKFETTFLALHGRSPTDEEIAKELEVSVDVIKATREKGLESASLDEQRPTMDGNGDTYLENVVDQSQLSPEEQTAESAQVALLLKVMSQRLTPRESQILAMRYGMPAYPAGNELIEIADVRVYTLEAAAKVLGITRERVRQLEGQALNKLRTSSLITLSPSYKVS